MGRSLELFDKPAREKPRVLMHVCDAGMHGRRQLACFACTRCDYKSDWLICETVTEVKRGVPCPKCNKVSDAKRIELMLRNAPATAEELFVLTGIPQHSIRSYIHFLKMRGKVVNTGQLPSEDGNRAAVLYSWCAG